MTRPKPPRKGTESTFDSELLGKVSDINTVKVVCISYTDYVPTNAVIEWAALFEVQRQHNLSTGKRMYQITNVKWTAGLLSKKQISPYSWEAIVQVKRKG